MPGVLTAKLVSRASRVSSKGSVEAAAASRLQGALAGQDDNPLFLGGIRVPPAETITDAMGAAIATGTALHRQQKTTPFGMEEERNSPGRGALPPPLLVAYCLIGDESTALVAGLGMRIMFQVSLC